MITKKLQRRIPVAGFLSAIVLGSIVAMTPVTSALAEIDVQVPQYSEPVETVAFAPASAEGDSLQYMREEEKLAHDVYIALYEKWGLPIFFNIARAESQHMSAVLQELEANGLADPAAGNDAGVFTNPELQALYNDLVAKGSESAVAALLVGATIEDLDIADLQESLATATDDSVRWVFENLMRGSENHLRAFVRNLSQYGEEYTPQYIDNDTYSSIVGTGGVSRNTSAWGGGFGRGQGRFNRWQ